MYNGSKCSELRVHFLLSKVSLQEGSSRGGVVVENSCSGLGLDDAHERLVEHKRLDYQQGAERLHQSPVHHPNQHLRKHEAEEKGHI